MPKFKPQQRRISFIDKKLAHGTRHRITVNCNTLARDYRDEGHGDVSTKTVQRDIRHMQEQGAPIEFDSRTNTYFYTEENYRLPAIDIPESDIFAVFIAEKALEQYANTPLHEKLTSVFDKIAAALPEKISLSPDWIDSRFSFFPEPTTSIDPDVWKAVFTALRDDRRLLMEYQVPGHSRPAPREFDPYRAVGYRGEWYLIGRCHYRNDVRTFAMSRIKKAKLLDTVFAMPADFDFQEFIGQHFGIFRGKKNHAVKIRFTPDQAPYVRERQWHPSQKIKDHRDGSLTLSFTTNALFEVKRWVLGWGPGAKVLAPKELKDMVTADLKEALRGYR